MFLEWLNDYLDLGVDSFSNSGTIKGVEFILNFFLSKLKINLNILN